MKQEDVQGCGLCAAARGCAHHRRQGFRWGRRGKSAEIADTPALAEALPRIALVGNPNVGKSVIFSLLTGQYATVSNYPGTTVEISRGQGTLEGTLFEITDTPGVNSLTPLSEDERVTRDWLLQNQPHAVLHVADAKNIRRTVLLAVQLAEMGLPLVLALNMYDECAGRGIRIDPDRLAGELGVHLVPTVAVEGYGMAELKKALCAAVPSSLSLDYGSRIEKFAREFASLVPDPPVSARSLALMYLCGDPWLEGWIEERCGRETVSVLADKAASVRAFFNRPLDYVIAEKRLRRAEEIVKASVVRRDIQRTPAEALGEMATRPLTGIPIFLAVIYLVFKLVGQFGAGTLVDLMENVVFGRYLLPLAQGAVNRLFPWQPARDALMGDYGLISMGVTYAVSIVMPIVGTFFVAFGFLEDSGYLPRLSVMANRIFRIVGLSGKAVLPMILGLGCATMATLTTRILDSRKERVIATLLLALGIPCSAQLGVMMSMLSWISPAAMFFVLAVVGLQLLLVGRLAALMLPGERSDFIQELPPIRMPQMRNVLFKMLTRMRWFLAEAVPFFLLGTFILFLLDRSGGLAVIVRLAAPVMKGMLGLPDKAVDFFILGFMRRDYGAAGLFDMARNGQLDHRQMIVSLVTLTLFVPCVANFFVIVKERGLGTALGMVGFIFPFAVFIGWLVRLLLGTGILPL